MEEGTTNQGYAEALEVAIQNALKNYLPRLESTSDARAEFYDKFKHEVEDYDKEFLDKYGGDLDTTLIFAGLFSAVASAFIAAIQAQLQPDYTQLSYEVLWMMANSTGLNPPAKPSSDSPWTGPDPGLVNVQAILFSSLAVSLLTAFLAMLGKQWLSRYSQIDTRGSLVERGRDRHRKMNGIAKWRLELVMESLPLMLQVSLLLLNCALSKYLFIIDSVVAWVVVGFTACGFLFYVVIVVTGAASYDCPFQTPLSLIIRLTLRFFKERRSWFHPTFYLEKWLGGQGQGGPRGPIGPSGSDGNNAQGDIRLHIIGSSHPPPVLFHWETDQVGYVLDSNCIAWMFKMTTDPDVILHIMKFIPEIIWHNGIPTTPLVELYDTVLKCFDYSSEDPVVVPKLRNGAYLGAKALLHLVIQRKCIGDGSDQELFDSISARHLKNIGSRQYKEDPDLESTLGMVDCIFSRGGFEPIRWQEFTFTVPHHTWMSNIFLWFAWGDLNEGRSLPNDVKEFVRHSLGLVPPPPAQVVRDCLYVVDLVLKTDFYHDDPYVIDVSPQVNRIYNKLFRTFRNTHSTLDEIDPALEAMRLITSLSNNDVAVRSYDLFRVIMQPPVSPAHFKRKWEASRLALHGGCKLGQLPPPIEDPRAILDFLEYHFDLATRRGENQDGPIQNALRALASASGPAMNEAFKYFDPAKCSFVDRFLHVFQKTKTSQLLKPALFFLPLIADRWFNAPSLIMKPNEMERLCEGWAAAVNKVWSTDDIREPALAVLLDMINSPRWRPYVARDKWKLLGHFASIPDHSRPLKRCLKNPDLVDAVSEVQNPHVIVLWWMVLWLRYERLIPEVQERFDMAVKGARKEDVNEYLSVINSESEEAKKELLGYGAWPTDPKATALQAKITKLEMIGCVLNHVHSVT